MGTWQTFDPPSIDEPSLKPLEEVTRLLFEAGGRVIDSSPMYGKAEQVTGIVSQRLGINDKLFLATKVWTRGEEASIRQMESSMQKLGRGAPGAKLDLVQVHNLLDWQTHLNTLRAWKGQGRLRYIGVTHYSRSAFGDLERIIRNEKIDFVQLPYSVLNRAAEEKLLPAAAENGVAVLVMRPFEEGELFSRVKGKALPESVKGYADNWACAFLKWIIAHPAVTCAIPATSKPQHLRDNVSAGFGRLPDKSEREELVRFLSS
jgi:diketogulonate reductase-like aldo/keto reductase